MTTTDTSPSSTTAVRPGSGPLVVSPRNPRYFMHRDNAGGRAVYLTGQHIWNNLQDGMGPGASAPDQPEGMDFDAYLRFLTARGHNLIRLWRWEQFRSQAAGGNYHLDLSPQPWARTGPGTAKDGKPRFDLERFDETFFSRLRQRVPRAAEAVIYVDVMLFDGWALHLSAPPAPTPDPLTAFRYGIALTIAFFVTAEAVCLAVLVARIRPAAVVATLPHLRPQETA